MITLEKLTEIWQNRNPYCSQCGKQMKARIGGTQDNVFVWECSGWNFMSRAHDTLGYQYFDRTAKFDVKTGKPL